MALSELSGCVEAPSVSDITATSCVLSWRPPDDDGGAPVLGYHVEQCRTNSFGWMRLTDEPTTETTYTPCGLIKSFKYTFRIIAVNKNGEGGTEHKSVEIQAIEPPAPPAQRPTVCDITFKSCIVSWEPPPDDGGAPISEYRIEQKQDADTSWTTVGSTNGQMFSIRASELVENNQYCFRVRAINKAGEGMPSDSSDSIKTTGPDMSDGKSIAVIDANHLAKWGMTRVKAAFQRGLTCINQLVDSILSLRDSVSFRENQLIDPSIRHFAAEAYFNMRDSSNKAEILKNELNNRMEALTNEKSQKERYTKEKGDKMTQLQVEMAELQKNYNAVEQELERRNEEYEKSEVSLKKAENELAAKKRERDIVRGVGAGLLAIPFFGWIAGATMVAVSCTVQEENLKAAKKNRDIAKKYADDQKRRVSEEKLEISKCEKMIDRNESERDALESQINALEKNIEALQAQYKHQSSVCENLRKCVTYISITADRTEILYDQVKFLYNPATIAGPLNELAAHLLLPGMEQFELQTDNPTEVDAFVSKLKMIVDADDSWKQDNVLDFKKDQMVIMATESGKLQQKEVRAINTAVDRQYMDESSKQDIATMLSQHAGWEEFLVPTPMSIAFLGQLMLLSTQTDFPLDKHPPAGGFKFLEWPKSFRATVLQVANAGWEAFNKANHNMDQIRIYASTLPQHLTSAFDILSNASHEELERCLPLCLSSINNVAEKCLANAQSTEDEFMLVMDTVAEFQEACVSSKSDTEEQRENAQISLDVAAELKKAFEEEKEFLGKQKEQIQDSVEEAEKRFDEAITSLPSNWNLLGMAIVEGIVNGPSAVFSNASETCQTVKKVVNKDSDTHEHMDEPTRKSYEQSFTLHKILNMLNSTFLDVEALRMSEVMNSSKMKYCDIQVEHVVTYLQMIQTCAVREHVLQLAERTSSVCKRLEDVKESIAESTEEELGDLAIDMTKLQDEVSRLAGKGQSLMDACPRLRPPNMQAWQSRDEPDAGAVKSTINNALDKTEKSCEMLKNAQQNYDMISEDLTDVSNRMSDVLVEMAGLNLEKLDFEKMIDVLHRGLIALGSIREQWGKLVQFIQTIVNLIYCSLNVSLKNFLDVSEKANKSALEGYTLSDLKTDMLYQQITHISELAWFVSMIADSYLAISTEHLMPTVDGLPQLLNLDPEKDKAAIQLKMGSLQTECNDAQLQIASLLSQKKQEFDRIVIKRVEYLQVDLKSTLQKVKARAAR